MIVDQRPALILLDWMMPGGVSGVIYVAVSSAMKISEIQDYAHGTW